ncbi:hypothetical protein JGU66_34675 [Myxococcaceae bacterium JPH2]|nr:hypothetical protein [Myxococcaceae bacterium JPH2]
MKSQEAAEWVSRRFENVHARFAVTAAASNDSIVCTVTTYDEQGAISDIKEQPLGGLAAAGHVTEPARFDAFLRASAAALRTMLAASDFESISFELLPHELFVLELLADASLLLEEDFLRVLEDSARREVYVARAALADFLVRTGVESIDDDTLRSLHALTPAGRVHGLAHAVASVKSLAARGHPAHALLVAMMEEWVEEESDPSDQAWAKGPLVTDLLLAGTFELLEPTLTGELRRHAIECVDRLARRPSCPMLDRAGFLSPS